MVDDPRKNLKWLEQQLLEAEAPQDAFSETEALLQRADALLEGAEVPAGNFSRKSKGAKAEKAHVRQQFDPASAVLTKTKGQLRKEKRQRKRAEKKAAVNRSIGGLVFLAVLESIGILVILGWWLQ